MRQKEIIGSYEAVLIIMNTILPTALLSLPVITISAAKRDAWISSILATCLGLVVGRLVSGLILKSPDKNFYELSEDILGTVFGKIVGFVFFLWIILSCGEIVREYGEFLITVIMPDTPIIVFMAISVAVAAYIIRSGFEVLARMNILFVIFLIVFTAIFAISFMNARFDRLLPILDTGVADILKGALVPLCWMGQVIVFSVFSPCLKKPDSITRVIDISILLIGIHFFLGVAGSLMIFGQDISSSMLYPVFNQVRTISLANFLERLDYIVFIPWVIGGFIKIGIFYFAAVIGVACLFRLCDYRPMVAPVGIIITALSLLLHDGIVDQIAFLKLVWSVINFILFNLCIPLLLFTVSWIKRRGRRA